MATEILYTYEEEPMPKDPPQALLWRIVVQPLKPISKTTGGIIIQGEAEKAQEYNTYIGRVVSLGPLAYKARTAGGLDMSSDPNVPKVGDFVAYGKYAGQRMETHDGAKYLVLDDDAVLTTLKDPRNYRIYL